MALSLNGTSGISGVDGSAGTPALQGSDTNTGISFGTDTVNINTGGTTRATVDSSGRVLVGTSTARANYFNSTLSAALQIEGTGHDSSSVTITRNSNDGSAPTISLAKSRGTATGSNTVVQSGDDLGYLAFQGSDGSEFVGGAYIYATVDGTPGANDLPTRLSFSTTADGASSPTERMRITNGGWLKVSNTGSYFDVGAAFHEIRSDQNNAAIKITNSVTSGYTDAILVSQFTGYAPNNTTARFLYCGDTSAERATIRSNGGLANFQANNVNLSDRNAKKDISPAADTWGCVKEWEIVNYRYKDQPDDADLNLGVIAQQVAESCPEVITVYQEAKEATEDQPAQEERLGIKEQQMYWMAIKALQEAQVRIEALEAEVAALKAS